MLTEFWFDDDNIIFFYFRVDNRTSMYKWLDIQNRFLLKFIFSFYPEEEYGWIFRKKWKTLEINENYICILSFVSWFRKSYFRATKQWLFGTKNRSDSMQKHRITSFEKYFLELCDWLIVFLDILFSVEPTLVSQYSYNSPRATKWY